MCLLEGTVTAGQADCDRRLVPLGGHGDSRASGLASGEPVVLARDTTGTASSHLGMGIQELAVVDLELDLQEKQLLLSEARTRAAGGGEVKTGEEEL